MAKTRVAPLKELTLPRLELMAAVLGARLARHVQQSISAKTVYLWSDSQIVLHWLHTSNPLKTFVANRVKEIHDLTEKRKWRYCPTAENPADLLTRGITSSQFKKSNLWMRAPDWLNDNSKWPYWEYNDISTLTTMTEDCQEHQAYVPPTTTQPTFISGIHNVLHIQRFSRYRKLLRVTAYILRFIYNCKNGRTSSRLEPLTVQELHVAEKMWLRSCQTTTYHDEIESMKSNGRRLPLVKQLRLFIDDPGDIRCGGRIHNAPLDELEKFPYLLPSRHSLTRLIVLDAHVTQLHAGVSSTVTHLRQKYWISTIRRYVQYLLRKCVICRKTSGRPYPAPDPPPLPKNRVEDAVPFTVTGVDFTGALYIRNRTGSETKVYICLFTCASTRAVHLEVVPDLSAESFMLAFRRFSSRKSLPRTMISDNATTFNAASTQLRLLFQSTIIREELSNHGTQWQFIPKRAPWFGGWWERLIGLTKTTIKKILGRAFVSHETLQIVVTEIEAIMNDRPLTYVTSDAGNPEPLTPAHLLYGRRVTSLPYRDVPDAATPDLGGRSDVSKRARAQATLISHFRERWKREYLTSLREHHQTTGNNQQTIKIGDVVQVHDDITPRLRWKTGVVTELITGNDGLTRAAMIRTTSGITSRPLVKLYPLEVI